MSERPPPSGADAGVLDRVARAEAAVLDRLRRIESEMIALHAAIKIADHREASIEKRLNRRLLIAAGILLAVVVGGENALKYLPALVAGASEPGPAEIAADPGVPYLPEATP